MEYVAKVRSNLATQTQLSDGSPIYIATDGYGRIQIYGETSGTTTGTSKIITEDGYYIDYTVPSTGVYALKMNEVLIQNAEDNTNNVIHTSLRPLSNATNAMSYYQTTALGTNGVIKASAGKMYKLSGYIVPSTSDGYTHYLQIHNLTAVPADTAVPNFVLPYVAATNTVPVKVEYEFCTYGKYNDTGICWNLSSTGATKTLSTVATAWLQVSYI